MSNAKVVMGQAANTLVKPLEVEDVFSTYLYEGNASTQTITNGIDLSGEGGLVWIKNRDYTYAHMLHDTEATGVENVLRLPNTGGISYDVDTLTSFNSDGFTIGADSEVNENGTGWTGHTSWTFRKAPKFFDVVTYTGDDVDGREIAHNLGTTPACIIIKNTDAAEHWQVWHKDGGGSGTSASGQLNQTNAFSESNTKYYFGDGVNKIDPTSAVFTVHGGNTTNNTGDTYVAYLFAHNDGDGEFGPDADADIIKCGSYTGNGNYTTGNAVDVGFEPQWVMIKNASRTDGNSDWVMYDTMRGFTATNEVQPGLFANLSDAETSSGGKSYQSFITTSGFTLMDSNEAVNFNGDTYIYIAIRRGTKVPESGTEVFAVSDRKNEIPSFPSGFPVDFLIGPRTINGADNNEVKTRLISGGYLRTNTTGAENSSDQSANFAHNDGFFNFAGANANQYSWMWKRAPNFCDVVAYTGDGTAGRTVSHNLGVAPEMMWVKKRNSSTNSSWIVYHSGNTAPNTTNAASNFLVLNSTQASLASLAHFNQTMPSSTEFTLGTSTITNASGDTYIAYLFASLPGISKVGSYTGSNDVGSQTIDCGFTSGARFVLIKSYTGIGEWFLFDSLRGITVGSTDPLLQLQSTDPEYTEAAWSGVDMIQPHPSGFTLATSGEVNNYTRSYIFYAIA